MSSTDLRVGERRWGCSSYSWHTQLVNIFCNYPRPYIEYTVVLKTIVELDIDFFNSFEYLVAHHTLCRSVGVVGILRIRGEYVVALNGFAGHIIIALEHPK